VRLTLALVTLVLIAAVLAPVGAGSNLIVRDATQVRLKVNGKSEALVSYRVNSRGPVHNVLAWGAVNARAPKLGVPQVHFRLDYAGGWGRYRRNVAASFSNKCGKYDGPWLPWLVTACKAPDGSYWALQRWQLALPNLGFSPWMPKLAVWELHLSHWTGPVAKIEAYTDWIYSGRFHEIFGRATYRGGAIHGFGTTGYGAPTDRYGRLLFLDTYNSAYGPGWKRENSFVAHRPTGAFCYGFFGFDPSKGGYIAPPGYPAHQLRPPAQGQQYHLTMVGPGVTPDVAWAGDGLPNYDPNNPVLVELEQRMNAVLDSLGDRLCRRH
jgi:hypothetical protein